MGQGCLLEMYRVGEGRGECGQRVRRVCSIHRRGQKHYCLCTNMCPGCVPCVCIWVSVSFASDFTIICLTHILIPQSLHQGLTAGHLRRDAASTRASLPTRRTSSWCRKWYHIMLHHLSEAFYFSNLQQQQIARFFRTYSEPTESLYNLPFL